MTFDVTLYVTVLVTLFVIMDPPGAIPVFLSLVGRKSKEERNRAAWQAPAVSLTVITLFAIGGQAILGYLHIGIPALQGAGGLLLLIIALSLLTLAVWLLSGAGATTAFAAFSACVFIITGSVITVASTACQPVQRAARPR